jgi:hypothetical protein
VRNFWDFSFTYPAPDAFVQFGVDAASYTGPARASRAYYDSLRQRGVRVLGVQETTSDRSQQGYNAGQQDVAYARQRWAEVGFGDGDPICYVVSDGSRGDPNWNGEQIAMYGQAVGDYEHGPYLFYGNRYAVDAACAGAARSQHPGLALNLHGGWIPRTWNFDQNRDTAAQEIGSTPVAGTDVNTVYREIFDGAAPGPTPSTGDADMFVGLKQRPNTTNQFDAAWCDGGVVIRWFSGPLVAYGYLQIPQDATEFAARSPVCRVEVVTEWPAIEKRTVATQTAAAQLTDAQVAEIAAQVAAAIPAPPDYVGTTEMHPA